MKRHWTDYWMPAAALAGLVVSVRLWRAEAWEPWAFAIAVTLTLLWSYATWQDWGRRRAG